MSRSAGSVIGSAASPSGPCAACVASVASTASGNASGASGCPCHSRRVTRRLSARTPQFQTEPVYATWTYDVITYHVRASSSRSLCSAARSSRAAYHVNFPLEVRFVAADDIPMSPASGRDSCYLGAYIASETWAVPYFADFENLMTDYAGRPHWGKTFTRTHRQMRQLYPEYDRFDALRRAADPAGVFHNRFVERVFAPGQSPAQ